MNIARFTFLIVLAIGLTASCSHVPRMTDQSPETNDLRAQYLREHPSGPHNVQIVRGEVVRGMDALEVLASWGIPERRFSRASENREEWTYTSRDKYSPDYVVYELVFVDRVLSRWYIDRSTTGAGVRGGDAESAYTRTLSRPDYSSYPDNRSKPKK